MVMIQSFEPSAHLYYVRELINAHLASVVPGWALTDSFILEKMQRHPGEFIVDPWVAERQTLCAVEGTWVTAVAHLLRYRTDQDVGPDYRGAAEIGWFAGWPSCPEAAVALLLACRDRMDSWEATHQYANINFPAPVFSGVPDSWPHIEKSLRAAGFTAEEGYRESVYAGSLAELPAPHHSPVEGVTLGRRVARWGVCFTAVEDSTEVGWCEWVADLTAGGALPAMGGWAELAEMQVEEDWRGRGLGTWLVQHGAQWVRLAGCTRTILNVAADDEAAGAGRFYNRFGWRPISRLRKGWTLVRD